MDVFTQNGQRKRLGHRIGGGGEGGVYEVVGLPDQVAKYYTIQPTRDVWAKLHWMIAHPPKETATARGHTALAWPSDLLFDDRQNIVGFLMPYFREAMTATIIYNRGERLRNNLVLKRGFYYIVARNLAAAVGSLHAKEYVVGDLNDRNVLVNRGALVTLIDTDSFQVTARPPGKPPWIFRCPVGTIDYTPPELFGKVFAQVDRTPEHDRFALAVLIFILLMDGNHPFRGKWNGSGEPPERHEKIQQGLFPHGSRWNNLIEPPRDMRTLDSLGPTLAALMRRCFEEGHSQPSRRPTADEWRHALMDAYRALPTQSSASGASRTTFMTQRNWSSTVSPVLSNPPDPLPPSVRFDLGPVIGAVTHRVKQLMYICAVPAAIFFGWTAYNGVSLGMPSVEWCSLVPSQSCDKGKTRTPTPIAEVREITCCPKGATAPDGTPATKVALRRHPIWTDEEVENAVGFYPDGTIIEVCKGRERHENQFWYQVRVVGDGKVGWVADWQTRPLSEGTVVERNTGGGTCAA